MEVRTGKLTQFFSSLQWTIFQISISIYFHILAIEKKLNSNLPLEERCVLARNVYFSDSKTVNIGQKDSLVVDWALSILMKKFSQNAELSEDAELWKLLLAITDSARFEVNFLAVMTPPDKLWDLLNNTVDHSSQYQKSQLSAKWLQMLLRKNRHVRAEMFKQPDSLNHFIGKCLQNDFIVNDAIWLYNLAVQQTVNLLELSNFQDVLLPKLMTVKTGTNLSVSELNTVNKLISRGLFSSKNDSARTWDAFLTSVIEQGGGDAAANCEQKPKSTEMVENLFNKLSSMSYDDQIQALKMLFKSGLVSSGITNQSKAQLFCLACNVLQLYPLSDDALKMIPLASTLLPKFKMDLEQRMKCLDCLIDSMIEAKFDLTTLCVSSVETSTLLKFVQHLLKYLLDNYKGELGHIVCEMVVNLAKYSPLVTEPLIGTFSLSVLVLKKHDLMCQTITLYHKLRQLPKLMARLLMAMGKSTLDSKQFEFDAQSLQCFAEKVSTLPVGQVLDLWKTFEYHLKNAGSQLSPVIDQLMSAFTLNACLVEQAIPDLTMDKIVANIKATLGLIQSSENQYPKLENSLNELCIMLRHTRNDLTVDLVTESIREPSLTNLQKRKLENIGGGHDRGGKKAKITNEWSEIKTCPTTILISVLPDLSDDQLELALEEMFKNESIQMIKALLEEDPRIQQLLLAAVIKEICAKTNSKFLQLLLRYFF